MFVLCILIFELNILLLKLFYIISELLESLIMNSLWIVNFQKKMYKTKLNIKSESYFCEIFYSLYHIL